MHKSSDPAAVAQASAEPTTRRASRGIGLIALVWLGVALLTYRPWALLPFDIWDFQEFIPRLRAHDSGFEQLRSLLVYYADQGRFNAALYAFLVIQWNLFGEAAAGWQLLRFAVMLLDVALVWVLLHRMGMSWFGAAAGAGLLLGGVPAYRNWVQILGEPQALAALVLAALAALGFQRARRWGWHAGAIVVLLAFVMLSKEVLGVLGIPIVILACCWTPDGRFGRPGLSRRNVVLSALVLLLALTVLVTLVSIRSRPSAVGYGMAYGTGELSVARFLQNFAASVLPSWRAGDDSIRLLYPANPLFILIVALGWIPRLLDARTRAGASPKLGWFLCFPLLGVLAYLPWPKFDSFYALPFFLGAVMLFGQAVTWIEQEGRVHRVGVRIAALLVVAYLGLSTQRSSATSLAALRLNVALAKRLPAFAAYDSVVIVGPRAGPRRLPVLAAELRGYAVAMEYGTEQAMPRMRDLECSEGPAVLRETRARVVLVTYSYGCGLLPRPSLRMQAEYQYRDWVSLATVRDTFQIDLRIPR